MKTENTFQSTISLGLTEGYDGVEHRIEEVYDVCREYCDRVKLAVTVTPTKFIYVNGSEFGCFVELINYPRFPSTEYDITVNALDLATILMKKFQQQRVSVICTNKTYMLEESDYA
jgi:hypothetical protein